MTRTATSIDPHAANGVRRAHSIDRRMLFAIAAAGAATALLPLAGATAAPGPLQVNPADEIIRIGPLEIRFMVAGANSNGSLAAFEMTVPGGQRLPAPAHSHDHYEETIYGLDGVLTWTVDGKVFEIGPGQTLCIPRGAVHRFDNHGTEKVKQLSVISPAAIGPEFFRESAAVINASAGGPPDRAKVAEIMRRYGLKPGATP